MSDLCAFHPPGILVNVNLKLNEEVRSLRQQGDTPLADTMPNFALEPQGKLSHHPSSFFSVTMIHMCVTVEHVWRLISNFCVLDLCARRCKSLAQFILGHILAQESSHLDCKGQNAPLVLFNPIAATCDPGTNSQPLILLISSCET